MAKCSMQRSTELIEKYNMSKRCRYDSEQNVEEVDDKRRRRENSMCEMTKRSERTEHS